MKHSLWLIYLICAGAWLPAQVVTIRGRVASPEGTPLAGSTIRTWPQPAGGFTDTYGNFVLTVDGMPAYLVVTYTGYKPDTVMMEAGATQALDIRLAPYQAAAVAIEAQGGSTRINPLETRQTEVMTQQELTKAACCNLSESFETNPSVDTHFADAVTGTKQIQLLGLAGAYVQITRESMPGIRGLSTGIGLDHVPGPWIESIQISKGAGSVVNGYEAVSGQINVELKKPSDPDKVFFNAYYGQGRRREVNVNAARQLSDRVSTILLVHGSQRSMPDEKHVIHDRNEDGFADMPDTRQWNILNRWQYRGKRGLEMQLGVQALDDLRTGGQVSHFGNTFEDYSHEVGHDHPYGIEIRASRREAWAKAGYVFPGQPYRSVGLQVQATDFRQTGRFGIRAWDGQEQVLYANLIYQSILFHNTNHGFRAGLSYLRDQYAESVAFDEISDPDAYDRLESVPGVFAEYTWQYLTRFSIVAGLRADHHNIWGAFLTPRLHLRYAPDDKTVIRLAAGRGQRTANVFADNTGAFVSGRAFRMPEHSEPNHGLNPETAWNLSATGNRYFTFRGREGSLTGEYYYTWFTNQVVADYDAHPQEIRFYNLEGPSYAHNVQLTAAYELRRRLDIRLAWKWQDVRTTYGGVLRERLLTPRTRSFVNLAYKTRSLLAFDLTVQHTGSQRLPDTRLNPVFYQFPAYAPAYWQVHAQVTKTLWQDRLDVYVGGENLTNTRIQDPILAAGDPFGPFFDASMVWGPIFGRMLYGGLRLKL